MPCSTASPARWPYVLLMSRRRSRSAITRDSGRSKRDARLLLKLRHGERAVYQEERGGREDDQPRIRLPEGRRRHTEHGQHEVRREALEREETGVADRKAAGELQ